MKINFATPSLFLAVARFASDEQSRYYLRGVCVQKAAPGGLLYTATDGHRLLQAYDQEAEMEDAASVIVSIEKPKFSASWFKALWMTWDGDKLETDRADLLKAPPVDGSFPDWTRVIPKSCSGEAAQFNANYMADFASVGKMGDFGVPHFHHNGLDPALVTFTDKRLRGVLTALRAHATDAGMPYIPDAAA